MSSCRWNNRIITNIKLHNTRWQQLQFATKIQKRNYSCYGLLRNNSYSQCFTPTTGRQSENSLMTECCSLSCVDERPRATHSLDSVLFVPVPFLLVRFSFVHCVHLSTNCSDCTQFCSMRGRMVFKSQIGVDCFFKCPS